MRNLSALLLAACAVGAIASPSSAACSEGWEEVGRSQIPLYYYQGMTHDEAGNRYFTGIHLGLYRTDPALGESAANYDVIPPEVHLAENYNHVGDLSYHDGNLYLPLECYYPPLGNTCNTGSIGVADPETLEMEYYVKLDPEEIKKAMWCEMSPNGKLLWTQEGNDLLAYDMRDFRQENAAPDAAPVQAVKKLVGAVPPSGITGATFIGSQVVRRRSNGCRRRDIFDRSEEGDFTFQHSIEYVGESEGLDDDFEGIESDELPGELHYMVQPYNEEGYPTNGVTNGVIYHLEYQFPPVGPGPSPTPDR